LQGFSQVLSASVLPAGGILHPEMRKALVVMNPQNTLHLTEKVNGSHIHSAFFIGGELREIIEHLGLCVYPAIRFHPLEALV